MKIVALAGGVGGAKLADGLSRALPPGDLTVVVNIGDDFEHWGLKICPDLDTVCYTLAGLANPETGWGRADETWNAFAAMQALGAADWFRVGDKDLGTHVERTRRLRAGELLSRVTQAFCQAWAVGASVLPATDDSVPTLVDTAQLGELAFQEYFVHLRCEPEVTGFRFAGVDRARPAPGVVESIANADAIVICPSNPWVSIDPILAVPGLRAAMRGKTVVAVSPIIAGQTVKGPAAKMFSELGIEPSALSVAEHYLGLVTAFVQDVRDADLAPSIDALGVRTLALDTLMKTPADRERLARDVLHFVERQIT